jgi:hypothetical protein
VGGRVGRVGTGVGGRVGAGVGGVVGAPGGGDGVGGGGGGGACGPHNHRISSTWPKFHLELSVGLITCKGATGCNTSKKR